MRPPILSTRSQFFAIQVPDRAIAAMSRTLSAVRIPGLRAWFDALDPEFIRDVCAAYQMWRREQRVRKIRVRIKRPRRAK